MELSAQSLQLEFWLREQADSRGFHLTGICPAVRPPYYDAFCQWLEQGMAGTMSYLPQRKDAYQHPRHVLDGVQSVVMLGLSYFTQDRRPIQTDQGLVARYAWGSVDYHDWIHRQFKQWLRELRDAFPGVQARGVVDTAPLLERDFARLAGLGWYGKNTMLINKHSGSYFLLAALLLDQPLPYDSPHLADHCGTCTRCLDHCPTNAFPEPGTLDARRCISYLTIESGDAVPVELRTQVGNWLFGCDVCQDVCPWNRHSHPSPVGEFQPSDDLNPIDLIPLFQLDDTQFRDRFRKTPLWRSKRAGLLKNAALVLGNQKSALAVPALQSALLHETDGALRVHAAWALGQIDTPEARFALQQAAQLPNLPPDVRQEVDKATSPKE